MSKLPREYGNNNMYLDELCESSSYFVGFGHLNEASGAREQSSPSDKLALQNQPLEGTSLAF